MTDGMLLREAMSDPMLENYQVYYMTQLHYWGGAGIKQSPNYIVQLNS